MRAALLLPLLLLLACGPEAPPPTEPPNRWSDERLWPVLVAQEQRDVNALCALLNDSTEQVRAAAAWALASVQDSTAAPCLLTVLRDTSTAVRLQALFALGFIANTTVMDSMALLYDAERDSTLIRAYQAAFFKTLQRRGWIERGTVALEHLRRSEGHERMRAADALRRMPIRALVPDSAALRTAWKEEREPEVRATLLSALARLRHPGDELLIRRTVGPGHPAVERIAALRAISSLEGGLQIDELEAWCSDADPVFAAGARSLLLERSPSTALKALRWLGIFTGDTLAAQTTPDTEAEALALLRGPVRGGPYHEALRIRLLGAVPKGLNDAEIEAIALGDASAVVKQAAFDLLAARSLIRLSLPRAVTPDMQAREEQPLWERLLRSGDAGLISAAAEQLSGLGAVQLGVLLPDTLYREARAVLHPLRDLEALLLLDGLVAKRDGRSLVQHQAPPFNHPIDHAKLRALKQGQRYRITTAKGTFVIATDVDECPGSSLAFDSLVTAGYYNGKSFHRMVPNFVVQGGCPRGDGYGGMPWTLRTEIGRTPFTAGSVGLASAGRDTESCQFFITHVATPHLDGRYTRFGEVVEGMAVVMQLAVGDVLERVERIGPSPLPTSP